MLHQPHSMVIKFRAIEIEGLSWNKTTFHQQSLSNFNPTTEQSISSTGYQKYSHRIIPYVQFSASRDIPMYDMAYWMVKKLKHLVKDSPTTVNAPGEFLERLKGVTITGLFDVESMLSSITQSGH